MHACAHTAYTHTHTHMHTCVHMRLRAHAARMLACMCTHIPNTHTCMDAGTRQRALKAIGEIVETDPTILTDERLVAGERVRDAISHYFHDQAVSVREAAISLVGRYMVQRPDVTKIYIDRIIERRHDTGMSVRTSVCGILRDIVLSTNDTRLFVKCCEVLAPMVHDGEMRKHAIKVFHSLWLSDSGEHCGRCRSAHERLEEIVQILGALQEQEGRAQNVWFEKVIPRIALNHWRPKLYRPIWASKTKLHFISNSESPKALTLRL